MMELAIVEGSVLEASVLERAIENPAVDGAVVDVAVVDGRLRTPTCPGALRFRFCGKIMGDRA